jgi:2-keto-myo-inositol isomerase
MKIAVGKRINRRSVLVTGAALSAVAAGAWSRSDAAPSGGRDPVEPFGYCLNTSTIHGQGIGIVRQIEIAAQAGYQAVEPWIREIDEYTRSGGSLDDLGKRIRDLGLTVESAIGFPEWIVDDVERRAKGLEELRRNLDIVARLGGKRLAAPPAGATDQAIAPLRAAERYRAILELGADAGVVPQAEVWGFSRSLGRLGEAMLVAMECGHSDACVLPDVFHLYKGGSEFGGIRLMAGDALHVLHVNDYPASPPREIISDAQRVFPGDGVAPLAALFRNLKTIGFRGFLSLELFNREYWKQDPLELARSGLEKTRAVVRAALANNG